MTEKKQARLLKSEKKTTTPRCLPPCPLCADSHRSSLFLQFYRRNIQLANQEAATTSARPWFIMNAR